MKTFTGESSGTVSKSSKKGRYNFLIDPKVYADFSQICDEHGLIRSKKIELLMKAFVDEQSELLRRSAK